MRNFKKVMALAISAAALATSVSAFAELEGNVTGDLTGSYDVAGNSLTLTVDGAAGDRTVLVLDKGVVDTAATGDDILYINQYAEGETAYSSMGLKGTALTAGTYAIKIGYEDANGDFAIATGSLVVSEKVIDEPQYVEVLWGDIDSNGEVTATDAGTILTVLLGGTATTTYTVNQAVPETNVLWGDIDSNGEVTATDAGTILTVLLGGTATTTYTVNATAQLPKVSK